MSKFTKALEENDTEWFKKWEQFYFIEAKDPKRAKRRLKSPLQALSFVTQEYGHISSWDVKTLTIFLKEGGFSEVKEVEWKKGIVPQLLIDTEVDSRRFVSMYVEAVK